MKIQIFLLFGIDQVFPADLEKSSEILRPGSTDLYLVLLSFSDLLPETVCTGQFLKRE
jgi:hypothetical protein